MTYQKQAWVARETVVSAARMNHLEEGIEAAHQSADALRAKSAVSYALNTQPSIPSGSSTVPSGWTVFGEEIPAITYAGDSFRFNVDGVFLVALNGSYNSVSTTTSLEYRVNLNGSRILAVFGSGDFSSRSGTAIATVAPGDYIRVDYYHNSGSAISLRPSSFNTIAFAQIA